MSILKKIISFVVGPWKPKPTKPATPQAADTKASVVGPWTPPKKPTK